LVESELVENGMVFQFLIKGYKSPRIHNKR